jgi:peptide/nickel transport system permease protein
VWTYVGRRLLAAVPVLFAVTVLTFLMVHLAPGNPATLMVPDYASPAVAAEIAHHLGLDLPWPTQYWLYLVHALHGDLGRSIRDGTPVLTEIAARFPYTVQLTVAALLVSLVIGLPLGVAAAVHRGRWLDLVAMVLSVVWVAAPSFYLALLMQVYFANDLNWLPVAGYAGPLFSLAWLKSIAMPSTSLGARTAAILARLTRSCYLEAQASEYVRTAHAKGLPRRVVQYKHVLKNALIPVITVVGLEIGGLLSGAFITETIFAWPGVGRLGVEAIFNRDLPVIQGTVLLTAVAFVGVNLLVDLAYAFTDPRVRYA